MRSVCGWTDRESPSLLIGVTGDEASTVVIVMRLQDVSRPVVTSTSPPGSGRSRPAAIRSSRTCICSTYGAVAHRMRTLLV
jgi:hypothetical protein